MMLACRVTGGGDTDHVKPVFFRLIPCSVTVPSDSDSWSDAGKLWGRPFSPQT